MGTGLGVEQVALRLALGAARGRIADVHAAEETLAELRSAIKRATDETVDELARLGAAATLIWSVLVAGTVDALGDDPPENQADLVDSLRSVTPSQLEHVLLGRLGAAKPLWEAIGFDTTGWAPWPDVEPGRPPRSVADLSLAGLVGLHVEIDVADHPDGGYAGRLVAARDDVLVLAWNRTEYGGVTLVPTGRALAVRVIDELLPWRLQDELEEMEP